MLLLEKKQESKSKYINIFNSTQKWKNAVDEVVIFYDGGKLPCILVENKIDLVESNPTERSPELDKFAFYNGYCGGFKTSAKTGFGINNAIGFLIKNIIQRKEAAQREEERKNILLAQQNYNNSGPIRQQEESCC